MDGQYVIQDPYHDYAIRFMYQMHRNYGWKAVCFYTNTADLRRSFRSYPQLRDPEMVAASYRVSDGGLPRFIDHLRTEHDVRAVIPHYEPAVRNAGLIAAGLGLSWSQPEVLARFRDKEAMKAHLRRTDPSLRVNVSQVVTSPDEAVAVAAGQGLSRYVLKPNDGFGNVGVAFFEAHSPVERVAAHWNGSPSLLLEEYVAGDEYHCDGQVDAQGTVTITDVFRYHRGMVNGKENIELGSNRIASTSPIFSTLADYTVRVMEATGLRRSPFHAEVKIDEHGPCLIEVAARLVGVKTADVVNFMHGGSLDVFEVAGHYYASAQPFGPLPTDWRAYDSRAIWQVASAVNRTERVFNLQGVDEVEAMPEFLFWTERPPEIGERLHRTTDIFGSAYIAVVQGPSDDVAAQTAERIRRLIRWNSNRVTPAQRARAAASLVDRRVRQLPSAAERRMVHYP